MKGGRPPPTAGAADSGAHGRRDCEQALGAASDAEEDANGHRQPARCPSPTLVGGAEGLLEALFDRRARR
eukprot:12573254-Alexandrium_andersonii.AAC.1